MIAKSLESSQFRNINTVSDSGGGVIRVDEL